LKLMVARCRLQITMLIKKREEEHYSRLIYL
jgi:hypothetical protein